MYKSILPAILLFCFFSSPVSSQDQELLKAAREIIKESGTCALISVNEKGEPRVRAMDPFAPEDDFTVWFGTNSNSRKVEEIKKDPRVNLYYMENDQSSYVTIFGKAELINDPAQKKRYWKEAWENFYPEDRKNYLLIKVTPEWLEVSSNKRGISSNANSWTPPRHEFKKEK